MSLGELVRLRFGAVRLRFGVSGCGWGVRLRLRLRLSVGGLLVVWFCVEVGLFRGKCPLRFCKRLVE